MLTITTIGDRRETYKMESQLAHWALSNPACSNVEWALIVMFGIIEDESSFREGEHVSNEAYRILSNALDTDEEVEVEAPAGALTKTCFELTLAA